VNNSEDSDNCFFQVADSSGSTEIFILWYLFGGRPLGGIAAGDRPPSATTRLLWTSQLSLLREAVASHLQVTIYHDDSSSFARTVQLGG
jgi:hypothetical protein